MYAEGRRPICQDTGIVTIFLKVGMNVQWQAELSVTEMCNEGIRRAYLVSQAIKASRVVGFPELGMEAIYEFELEDMPVTVAVDHRGVSIHQTGPQLWAQKISQMEVEFRP